MGRYIALGIPTKIEITKSYDNWGNIANIDLIKDKDNIIKDLNTLLDTSKFEIEYSEDSIVLSFNNDDYNNNIHDLYRELYPMITCDYVKESDIVLSEEFNQENYPFKMEDRFKEKAYFQSPSYYLFSEDNYKRNLDVNIRYVQVWYDCNKFSSEDETMMLRLLNVMSRKYYKSELSKNMLFYISG